MVRGEDFDEIFKLSRPAQAHSTAPTSNPFCLDHRRIAPEIRLDAPFWGSQCEGFSVLASAGLLFLSPTFLRDAHMGGRLMN